MSLGSMKHHLAGDDGHLTSKAPKALLVNRMPLAPF